MLYPLSGEETPPGPHVPGTESVAGNGVCWTCAGVRSWGLGVVSSISGAGKMLSGNASARGPHEKPMKLAVALEVEPVEADKDPGRRTDIPGEAVEER